MIIDATWNVNPLMHAIMKFRMRRRDRYECDIPHPLPLDGKYHMFCKYHMFWTVSITCLPHIFKYYYTDNANANCLILNFCSFFTFVILLMFVGK